MTSIVKGGHRLNVLDHVAFWQQVEAGEWEPYTFQILDALLTDETTYLDLGAWIGPTVLYAARKARRVLAFEPDPAAYSELVRNIALNGMGSVTAYRDAVSGTAGAAEMGTDEMGNSMSRIVAAARQPGEDCQYQFPVTCRSLDEVFITHRLNSETVVKMDIEGGEESLFTSHALQLCCPSLYVSLHPQWWGDRGRLVWRDLTNLAARYKRVYDRNLKLLRSFDDIVGTEILLTDRTL